MTTITVHQDTEEHIFITTGRVQPGRPRMVANLGDSEDNEDYLDEMFGAYEG